VVAPPGNSGTQQGHRAQGPRTDYFLDLSLVVDRLLHDDLREIHSHLKAFDLHRSQGHRAQAGPMRVRGASRRPCHGHGCGRVIRFVMDASASRRLCRGAVVARGRRERQCCAIHKPPCVSPSERRAVRLTLSHRAACVSI
jgi:hypothetical protein